ncbi:MAG: hypothetical protein HZB14_03375 [Actinobacteria bacterium]|nr:hypothetical protein [Actinomycetota bacterium]
MSGDRIVVCVLLPRFELGVAAARRGVDRQELLSRPVALAPVPGGRQVVGEVSAAAEAFAVTPGLPLSEAFARCPGLKLLPPDPAAARAEWEAVVRAIEGIGAEVESDPEVPGTAFFEAGGLLRLHGGRSHGRPAAAAGGGLDGVIAAVRAAVGRPLRVGVSRTRFVALAAARTTRPRKARLVLTARERREFLARAPVDWLALQAGADAGAGVGATRPAQPRQPAALAPAAAKPMRELADTLRKLGIETLGEFALLRRAQVAERFGATGLAARDVVHGREPPLRPRRPAEALSERIELIDDADGQVGVGYDVDGSSALVSVQAVQIAPASAGALAPELQHALALLIERLIARRERAGRTLRAFTLTARFAEGGSWASSAVMREPTADPARVKLVLSPKLLELPEPAASLELSVDAFGPYDHDAVTLFGADPGRERASRLHSAAEQARIAAGDPRKVARVMRLSEHSRLPERRSSLSPGPVALNRPRPIDLRADEDGRPLMLPARDSNNRWSRRAGARSRVPVAHERERWVVEDRWWTGRPLRRRYFELVLADGSNVVVFQDLASKRWFEQRG